MTHALVVIIARTLREQCVVDVLERRLTISGVQKVGEIIGRKRPSINLDALKRQCRHWLQVNDIWIIDGENDFIIVAWHSLLVRCRFIVRVRRFVIDITRAVPIAGQQPWRLNDTLEGFRDVGSTLRVWLAELEQGFRVEDEAAGFRQNYFAHAEVRQLNEIITFLRKQKRIGCTRHFVVLPIICIANICSLTPN